MLIIIKMNPANKCKKCNKKLKLSGAIKCRCGDVFCHTHCYSWEHECPIDYRQMGKDELKGKITETKAPKIIKI